MMKYENIFIDGEWILASSSERIEVENNGKLERWQIIFTQYVNPQTIEYMDIRRVGYNSTLQCIISKI